VIGIKLQIFAKLQTARFTPRERRTRNEGEIMRGKYDWENFASPNKKRPSQKLTGAAESA